MTKNWLLRIDFVIATGQTNFWKEDDDESTKKISNFRNIS